MFSIWPVCFHFASIFPFFHLASSQYISIWQVGRGWLAIRVGPRAPKIHRQWPACIDHSELNRSYGWSNMNNDCVGLYYWVPWIFCYNIFRTFMECSLRIAYYSEFLVFYYIHICKNIQIRSYQSTNSPVSRSKMQSNCYSNFNLYSIFCNVMAYLGTIAIQIFWMKSDPGSYHRKTLFQ